MSDDRMPGPGECFYAHNEDGRLTYTMNWPAPEGQPDAFRAAGHLFCIGPIIPNFGDYYALDGVITERPEMEVFWVGSNAAAVGDSMLLAAPAGAQIYIEGELAGSPEESGLFEVAAGEAATYDVRVELWPHKEVYTQFSGV